MAHHGVDGHERNVIARLVGPELLADEVVAKVVRLHRPGERDLCQLGERDVDAHARLLDQAVRVDDQRGARVHVRDELRVLHRGRKGRQYAVRQHQESHHARHR